MSSFTLNQSQISLSGVEQTSYNNKSNFLTSVAFHASKKTSQQLTCTSYASGSVPPHGERLEIEYQVSSLGKNVYSVNQKAIKGFHADGSAMSPTDIAKHKAIKKVILDEANAFLKKLEKSDNFLTAVARGNCRKVTSLIAEGVDLDCCQATKDGSPAIVIASRDSNLEMVKTLLNAGVKPDTKPCRPDVKSRTALGYAATSGNLEIVKVLIDAGAGLELKLDDGKTALFLAIENGERVVANELLSRGADYAGSDQNGFSILHLLAHKGFIELANKIMSKCRAEFKNTLVNSEDHRGNRPVDYAAAQESQAMLEKLYIETTDPHHQNNNGDTLLHIAARNGRTSFCSPLCGVGIRTDVKNNQGQTALDLCKERKFDECIQALTVLARVENQRDVDNKFGTEYVAYPSNSQQGDNEGFVDIFVKTKEKTTDEGIVIHDGVLRRIIGNCSNKLIFK